MEQTALKFLRMLNHVQLSFSAERLPDWLKDVDARVNSGIAFGKTRGFIKSGDPIVVVTGWKQGSGFTNTLRIVYVSDIVEHVVY